MDDDDDDESARVLTRTSIGTLTVFGSGIVGSVKELWRGDRDWSAILNQIPENRA